LIVLFISIIGLVSWDWYS